MKIAVFYSGYLPGEKYGGPVTSIYNFSELLGDDIDIFIICANHDLKESTPYTGIKAGWNIVGKASVMYLANDEYTKNRFAEIIDEIKPDLIYASSIFSVKQTYPLFTLSKQKKIPLLLAPRGELNNSALAIRKSKKIVYLWLLKLLKKLSSTCFQATSDEEKRNIIQNLNVDESRVYLLPNVPTVPKYRESLCKSEGRLSICYVGRIVENKNLLIALKAIVKAKANITFDIYGPIEDSVYWEECQTVVGNLPEHICITYKGAIAPTKIKDIYEQYDCFISPTKFENYGQSIVEAMLHDVPVIISQGTTPWNDIKKYEAGFTIRLDDVEGYTTAIDTLGSMNTEQYAALVQRLRHYCGVKFNYAKLKEDYITAFIKILDK